MWREATTAGGRTYGNIIVNIQGVLWFLNDGRAQATPQANNTILPHISVSEYQIANSPVADTEEKMAQQAAKPATCGEKERGEQIHLEEKSASSEDRVRRTVFRGNPG